MKATIVALIVAGLVAGGSAGCSSDPRPVKAKRGVLPPGTAKVTIDGHGTGATTAVHCADVGSLTMIMTGDDHAGVTVEIANQTKLKVNFVRIRNTSGFSGDYNSDLGGDAAAFLTEATYHVTGSAFGSEPESTAPAMQRFAIEATC